ncbi:hypothetical protein RJ639_015937 [Escallonia herrerae]|uniref:Transcriptional regulatory protein n=1 Tax=Escallonia herrerae TaxID=1293975 RepID=A0AA89ALN8_9ASTE|nr:hypothetical protein RJ639_015937 [Escallonia herrerae]
MNSASSIRAFGALLYKSSNGVPRKCPISFSIHGTRLLGRSLSSSSSYSFSTKWVFSFEPQSVISVRTISTTTPLCMGRRSCKIAGMKFLKFTKKYKEAQNAKKMKLYSKIGKEVVSAVKKGGPNAVSNTALAAVLEKAKELDVPKEILDRNVKRASEKGQEAYIEKVYESPLAEQPDIEDKFSKPDNLSPSDLCTRFVMAFLADAIENPLGVTIDFIKSSRTRLEVYGYGGVGIIVEVSTDKINRSVAAVRQVVRDCGGKMADPGSIMFKFKRARVVNIKVTDADRDQLLAIALDSGADDVIEPQMDEDDTEEDRSERYFKIVTSAENYAAILLKLREEGVNFEPDNGFELLSIPAVEVDDEAMDLNKELVSRLLELDDVDAVSTDQR